MIGFARRHHEFVVVAGALAALTIFYAVIFLPFLAGGTRIGNDYSIYFPVLLSGYYWFVQNGPFSIPWFSPSQCGGFPYFADPNAAYFSAPQILTFAVGPLEAARVILVAFAMLGFLGFYGLMRRSFRASAPASLMAAAIFMFNGYFAYRQLAGHLTFHASMLTPWVASALLPGDVARVAPSGWLLRLAGAGAALAYMYQAGMIHGILPALLAIIVIISIHAVIFGWRLFPWAALAGSGLLMLALCASKIAATLALAHQFPRAEYSLPGVPNLFSLIGIVFRALFWWPPTDAPALFVNRQFAMEQHEWEYGVSPAPLLVMLAWAISTAIKRGRGVEGGGLGWSRLAALSGAVLLALVPLLLNFYAEGWNAVLKGLPFFGNSSQLIRWFSAYIPIMVLLGGLALDRMALPGRVWPWIVSLQGIALMLIWTALADRSYYAGQLYDPAAIEAGYAQTAGSGQVPPIRAMGAVLDSQGRLLTPIDRNDLMVKGISQIACYQPIMGYDLEDFPVKSLHSGSATAGAHGVLNTKNPACYLFPVENHCESGDHFTVEDRQDAFKFLAYKPFDFAVSSRQKMADGLSLAALAALLVAPAGIGVMRVIRRRPK